MRKPGRVVRLLIVGAMACALIPFAAWAVPIDVIGSDLTGSRTTAVSGEIVATGGWAQADGGFELSWEISYDSIESVWNYSYIISNASGNALQKSLSHWILEVSPSITSDNASSLILESNPSSFEVNDFTSSSEGNSNPNLPGTLHGVKFDASGSGPDTFTFESPNEPVWGDFYAKDGVTNTGGVKIDVTAWNSGIGNDPTLANPPSSFADWIPTPDGGSGIVTQPPPETAIPEPATLALLGMGLFGAVVRMRKSRG